MSDLPRFPPIVLLRLHVSQLSFGENTAFRLACLPASPILGVINHHIYAGFTHRRFGLFHSMFTCGSLEKLPQQYPGLLTITHACFEKPLDYRCFLAWPLSPMVRTFEKPLHVPWLFGNSHSLPLAFGQRSLISHIAGSAAIIWFLLTTFLLACLAIFPRNRGEWGSNTARTHQALPGAS